MSVADQTAAEDALSVRLGPALGPLEAAWWRLAGAVLERRRFRRHRVRHPAPREALRLIDAAAPETGALVLLLLETGISSARARQLTWTEVDAGRIGPVALADAVVARLRTLPRSDRRVFPWRRRRDLAAPWQAMLDAAGLGRFLLRDCRACRRHWRRAYGPGSLARLLERT